MKGARAALTAAAIAATLLASCSPAATSGEDTRPEGTWGTDGEGQPQLVLAADGALSGTDGCNRLMGTWSVSGDQVQFEQVGTTRMACPDVDAWLASATVDVDTMHVLDASGTEIGTLTRTG